MEFIFDCSMQLEISRGRVRYKIEHEKKHTKNDVYGNFPKISIHFPKISAYSPNIVRRPHERFRFRKCLNIAENFWR